MSEVSDKVTFNRELPRHLRELDLLLGRPVHREELLSLEQTEAVRARAKETDRGPVAQFGMGFHEKTGPRFAEFTKRLAGANASDVYLWTPAANFCGVPRPTPLQSIRMSFPFDVNPEGILAILTCDFSDELLLDYAYGERDEQLLEIIVKGKNWGTIVY